MNRLHRGVPALVLSLLVAVAATGCGGSPGPAGGPVARPSPAGSGRPSGTAGPDAAPGWRSRFQRVVVVRHVDGDTLHVRLAQAGPAGPAGREVTVRLLEVDTPESVDPRRPVECFAAEASRALARMMPVGSTAWAEADRDLVDRYGRTLLYLYVSRHGRPVMVNLRLVQEGYAVAVLYEPNDRHIARLRAAEADARAAGRGLWSACPGR